MPIVTGDIVKADLVCSTGNTLAVRQVAVNTLHYRCASFAGNGATESDVASALGSFFAGEYKKVLSSLTAYSGVRVTKIFPLPTGNSVANTFGAGPGDRVGLDLLPLQDAGVITKKTAQGGRRGRGRLYFPFPTVQDNIAARPTVGYKDLLSAFAFLLLAGFAPGAGGNTSALDPVIYHKAAPASSLHITDVLVRPYFGTQRRRGEASGPDVFFPAA